MNKTSLQAYSDDVKRVKDEMDMHAVAGSHGWVAFHLSDGRPANHTAYERRQDAVLAMRWDRDNFMYVEIQPGGMELKEAEAVLAYARLISKMGFRIPDPEFDYDATMPYQPWDRARMARQLVSGKPLDPFGYTNLPSERLY